MNVLMFGNSGSGKTTLAKRLAARHGIAHLDLDSIVWEPGQIAVQRPQAATLADLRGFIDTHPHWVVEGCYGELVQAAAANASLLLFLNPGRDTCLAHNQARPWEPHKYASKAEQDAMLDNLQAWVAGYYTRNDDWSLAAHRRIFDAHAGDKRELTSPDDDPA